MYKTFIDREARQALVYHHYRASLPPPQPCVLTRHTRPDIPMERSLLAPWLLVLVGYSHLGFADHPKPTIQERAWERSQDVQEVQEYMVGHPHSLSLQISKDHVDSGGFVGQKDLRCVVLCASACYAYSVHGGGCVLSHAYEPSSRKSV